MSASPPGPADAGPDAGGPSQEAAALWRALAALLAPVATLAVARGLPLAPVEELLRRAFVDAALGVHGDPARAVSRISTTTGLNRREVTRLLHAGPAVPPAPRSLASEVFAHWSTDPAYRDAGGPRVLPRSGAAPSFESLAQAVTRDVHPRSLLEELCRLGVAAHDAASDEVRLCDAAFVPRGDAARMLGLLGANVGDHARAAVDNVCAGGGRHFEQAVFADALSPEAVAWARQAVSAQWPLLTAALVPALERWIEDDEAQGRPRPHRLRVGLYSFDDAPPPAGREPPPALRERRRVARPAARRVPAAPAVPAVPAPAAAPPPEPEE